MKSSAFAPLLTAFLALVAFAGLTQAQAPHQPGHNQENHGGKNSSDTIDTAIVLSVTGGQLLPCGVGTRVGTGVAVGVGTGPHTGRATTQAKCGPKGMAFSCIQVDPLCQYIVGTTATITMAGSGLNVKYCDDGVVSCTIIPTNQTTAYGLAIVPQPDFHG